MVLLTMLQIRQKLLPLMLSLKLLILVKPERTSMLLRQKSAVFQIILLIVLRKFVTLLQIYRRLLILLFRIVKKEQLRLTAAVKVRVRLRMSLKALCSHQSQLQTVLSRF